MAELLERLEGELRELVASWEYAFAMGHGCSLGDHPEHRAVREHAADLRARIAELRQGTDLTPESVASVADWGHAGTI